MLSAKIQNRLGALLGLFRRAAAKAQPPGGAWEPEVKGDLIFVFVDAKRTAPETWRPYLIASEGRDLRRTERLVCQIRSNSGILARGRDEMWTEVASMNSEGVEDAIAAAIREWLA